MKSKQYSTEGKIRILREAETADQSILQVCRKKGISEQTFQYEAKEPDAWLARSKSALRRVSHANPELGYAKITRLLREEGWRVVGGGSLAGSDGVVESLPSTGSLSEVMKATR